MLLTRHAARRAAAWSCAGRPTLGTRLAPGLGVRAPLARRVTPGWTPLASNSTISGAEPERKEERKPSGLRSVASDVGRLLQLYRPESRTLGAALTALVLSSGITLAVPAGMGFVIDTVTHTHDVSLGSVATGLTALFAFGGAANFARSYLLNLVGERITAKLRRDTYSSLLSQELGFFDTSRVGELVNRLSADTTEVGKTLSDNVSQGLRSAAQALGAITAMAYISPKLTVVMLAVVPPVSLGAWTYGRYVRGLSKEVQDLLGRATELADERLANVRTVRWFGAEAREAAAYGERVDFAYDGAVRRALANAAFFGSVDFGVKMSMLGVLYVGGHMVQDGAMSVGELTSFLLYTIYVGFSTAGLSSFFSDLMKGVGASQRLFELLDRRPAIADGECIDPPTELHGRIDFKDVHFAYASRPEHPVFRGLDLTVEPGETLALVGPSGCGKTTVGSLVARLYDVDAPGSVALDGRDVRSYPVGWLRQHMAAVSQEPVLFAGTIADNIAYGRPGCTVEDIVASAKDANAHEFISTLPDGYHTAVGEKGQTLSGGQKQRVAIARALLSNPRILVLDEATSALDPESEALVQEAIDRLKHGRTVLLVTHRPTTMQAADSIAVLDGGRVVQRGTYEELMAQPEGTFALLLRSSQANDGLLP